MNWPRRYDFARASSSAAHALARQTPELAQHALLGAIGVGGRGAEIGHEDARVHARRVDRPRGVGEALLVPQLGEEPSRHVPAERDGEDLHGGIVLVSDAGAEEGDHHLGLRGGVGDEIAARRGRGRHRALGQVPSPAGISAKSRRTSASTSRAEMSPLTETMVRPAR